MHCYSYIKLLSLYSRVSHYDGDDQILRKKHKEIITKYYQFGVLLLKDTTGARIEFIITQEMPNRSVLRFSRNGLVAKVNSQLLGRH